MAEDPGGEKTLPASERKKQRAREDGNVAKSQDLNSGVTLLMGLLALYLFGRYTLNTMLEAGRYFIGNAHELIPSNTPIQPLAVKVVWFLAQAVWPVALVMTITGVVLNFLQVGFLITFKPLQPKLDKLNPAKGFKKFASIRSLVELVKSIMKLTMVGFLVWLAFRDETPRIVSLMDLNPVSLVHSVAGLLFNVWWRIALAMVVIGIFDYAFQRWQRERDLRMTHQEAKEEMKEMEGDPQIKRRIRQLQRSLAAQRMMQEVPEADVIITNPTEYAVALRYDMENMKAPVVTAKGARLLAQRIREIAAENRVPIMEEPPLARTLYRSLEIGDAVPGHLFNAVAEVLAYVYRIDQRREKKREREEFWMRQAV
jgi:flagellar biosynthesis protein FlhB